MTMKPCPEEMYWDGLLNICLSCKPICSHQIPRACVAFCMSLSCHKEPGRYYDWLLKDCVSCASICGRHPKPCSTFCGTKVRGQGQTDAQPDSLERPQGPAHRGGDSEPGLAPGADPRALALGSLGLCVGALLCCLLLAACLLRRSGAPTSCRRPPRPCALTSDGRGSGARSAAGQPPEPAETCSCCFPECRAPTQETAGAPAMPGPAALTAAGQLLPDGSLGAACASTRDWGPAA